MIGELDEEWAAESDVEEWEAEEYDPEYDYDADEYYRDYPDESPTRQPLFYVLLGLVVVIGGLRVGMVEVAVLRASRSGSIRHSPGRALR
jgi:hypothetical protein